MKTDALGQVIRFAEDQFFGTTREGLSYEADVELKALEESHAWLARALLEQGETRDGQWHTRECWAADRGCILECQGAVSALRKAGLL